MQGCMILISKRFWIRSTTALLITLGLILTGWTLGRGTHGIFTSTENPAGNIPLTNSTLYPNLKLESAPSSSPIIDPCQNLFALVCSSRGIIRDPTGAVLPETEGELQALRIYENLIRQNPDWTSEQVDQALVREIYTQKRRDRVIQAQTWVKSALLTWIQHQPESVFDPREKILLTTRVKKTELDLPSETSAYPEQPDMLTSTAVVYERLDNDSTRMRVGGAYLLTAKSWYNLVFSLAHEFAHSIDPCELRMQQISLPSYDRLKACFISQEIVFTPKTRSECTENDQLSEAFADWVAAQITSQALEIYAKNYTPEQRSAAIINAVRDLCDPEESLAETDTEIYPKPETRITGIFGKNPRLKLFLNCSERNPAQVPSTGKMREQDNNYCTLNSEFTLPSTPSGKP